MSCGFDFTGNKRFFSSENWIEIESLGAADMFDASLGTVEGKILKPINFGCSNMRNAVSGGNVHVKFLPRTSDRGPTLKLNDHLV